MNNDTRSSFSGKLGFVLSAAGASVGLGNIWRFPYLAARYGGGIFLLVYVLLALTFGYTMIIAETSIGRSTRQSPVGAFRTFGHRPFHKFGGWINAIIPILIAPYYSVIGGWVCKYLFEYICGNVYTLADDSYFGAFITNGFQSELWFIVFTAMVLIIILMGVENGIERVSRIMMPILIVLAVILAIYSCTRPGAAAGIRYFLVPKPENFSWMTVVSAMGQMFYSLSIAMGILVTFGSYMKTDVSIEESTLQVELFDTGIAILAGLMIIPAVFAFSGGSAEHLNAGPSLMFITMPKIFASMGFGGIVSVLFFLLVLFAALTSAMSVLEAVKACYFIAHRMSGSSLCDIDCFSGYISGKEHVSVSFFRIRKIPVHVINNHAKSGPAESFTLFSAVYRPVGFQRMGESVHHGSFFLILRKCFQ